MRTEPPPTAATGPKRPRSRSQQPHRAHTKTGGCLPPRERRASRQRRTGRRLPLRERSPAPSQIRCRWGRGPLVSTGVSLTAALPGGS